MWPNDALFICSPCDFSCATCVSVEANMCTSCKGTAVFTPNTSCAVDNNGVPISPLCDQSTG